MKILIIGSSGFIGSNCTNYFSKKGHDVYLTDIFQYKINNYFILNEVEPDFEAIFKDITFDVCINCSGSANVSFSFDNPKKDFELNVLNVYKILLAIKQFNPNCKLINFSSAAVYGNPEYLPIDEKSIQNPLSPYGYHKLQSEILLEEYSRFFGLKTCSLRVFSAYGPGLKKQLFWDLYQKIRLNKLVEIFGTGEESRDFIYIDDLILAIELIIQKAKFNGESINIASGIEISIKNVVEDFISNYDSAVKYQFNGNTKIGDPLNWKADISILKSMGFLPKTTINIGISNYIKWLKENE